LIVGGGTVALRKVEKLLPYGPKLSVVAPSFVPELECIPELELLERDFRPSDLERACFVVAATDDKSLNHEISALCQGRGIPVNVADDKAACSFLFPALVRRGELSIGISTGGASPTAAIWLKEQMNALLPENMEEILGWLEQLRPVLKARFSGEKERSALFARLFYACLEANGPLTDEQLREILSQEVLFP
jgi:siroheme synthase-like protein